MRVLILNEYFYPDVASTAQHSSDLALALVREGHTVTVVTGRHGYNETGKLLPRDETWEGVRILRVSSLALGKTARWQRAAHFASFLLACSWRLLWLPSFDVVVAMTTPPLFSFLGSLFTRIKGGRLCVWMMDLNPDEAVAAGWLKPAGVPHRFLESLLRYSLNQARKIFVLDHFMEERIVAKGVADDKVVVLPPWSHDGAVQYDAEGRNEFRRRNGLEGKFVVMYSGNHSPCHPLDTLLEAADQVQQVSAVGAPIVFCFVGGGSEVGKVKAFVRSRNLQNVVCLPYQSVGKLGASLSAADLHVVVMGDHFVGIVHPCKIYNILRIGVPLVYIGPSQSHITEILPPDGGGGWAHIFRHGSAESVARCIQRCSQAGTRRFEAEIDMGREFSSDRLVPRMIASLMTATESDQAKAQAVRVSS